MNPFDEWYVQGLPLPPPAAPAKPDPKRLAEDESRRAAAEAAAAREAERQRRLAQIRAGAPPALEAQDPAALMPPSGNVPEVAAGEPPPFDLQSYMTGAPIPYLPTPAEPRAAPAPVMNGMDMAIEAAGPQTYAALIPGLYGGPDAVAQSSQQYAQVVNQVITAQNDQRQIRENQRQFDASQDLNRRQLHESQRQFQIAQAANARALMFKDYNGQRAARAATATANRKYAEALLKQRTDFARTQTQQRKVQADALKAVNRVGESGTLIVGTIPHLKQTRLAKRQIDDLFARHKALATWANEQGVRGTLASVVRNAKSIGDALSGGTLEVDDQAAFKAGLQQTLLASLAPLLPRGAVSDREFRTVLSAFGLQVEDENGKVFLPSDEVVDATLNKIAAQLEMEEETSEEIINLYSNIIGPKAVDAIINRDSMSAADLIEQELGGGDPVGDVGPDGPTSEQVAALTGDQGHAIFGVSDGWDAHAARGYPSNVHGIDFQYPPNTPVLAPIRGTVLRIGHDDRSGHYVKIRGEDGNEHVFAHLASAPALEVGAVVGKGREIGRSGNTGQSTGPHLHYQINGRPAPGYKERVEDQFAYMPAARNFALNAGIHPELFFRLIEAESGWKPGAQSPAGARGLTQLMPNTAMDLASAMGVPWSPDLLDSEVFQLQAGALYLGRLLKRYDGDQVKALVAYNWGPKRADNWDGDPSKLPAETQRYIRRILGE